MKSTLPLLFILILSCCSSENSAQEYLNELNESDFQALQREPLSSKYSKAQAVKLVYDLENEQIYYISNKFQYHNKFCQAVLEYNEPLGIFNRDNYGTDKSKRRFLLGNINYFPSRKEYVLELSPSDQMLVSDIHLLYQKVLVSSFLGDDLRFLLNSARLLNLAKTIAIPYIQPEEIYANQTYQPVSSYTSRGKLRKLDMTELKTAQINQDDILLINGTPLQLAGVSGIITTDLQTPLSHLTILGQNRKVPVMALKTAWEDDSINLLVGKYIELSVRPDGYSIKESTAPEIKENKNRRLKLKKNLSETRFLRASDFDRKTSSYCGYKAENFGILYDLSEELEFSVPEAAFGIPFYYYHKHATKSGVIDLIKKLESSETTDELLKEIRSKIKSTPIDGSLIEKIRTQMTDISSFERYRFRSSTNAEDMKGFSGAGLYTSKTAVIGSSINEEDEEKTIENALLKVWSSLWNEAAYNEREYFHIDHTDAMMGILVHRSFPDEEANGVVISKNLYRENNYGFVVNVQLGDSSVVQPNPDVTCDQFICYPTEESGFYSQNKTIEIITTSSLNENTLVMTEEEIFLLSNVIQKIKKHFYYRDFTHKTFDEYGLDFEFKLEKDTRDLYIKQVRPYNY